MARRKHSRETIAAIRALAQAGQTPRAIAGALERGDFPGLAPLPPAAVPPIRTIQHHAQRARLELEPVPDREEYARALEDSTRRLIRRDVRRIERLAQPTERDFRLLRSHAETIARLDALAAAPSSSAHPDRAAGGRARQDPARAGNQLEELARAIAEPVAPDPPD